MSSPIETLMRLALGYRLTQVVYVAARLGIADHLAAGPLGAAELANVCGAAEAPLRRLLGVLADEGVVERAGPGRYGLTAVGQYLRSDAPGGVRARAIMSGEEQYRAWAEALHSVRTGEPGFDRALGQGFWAHLDASPAMATAFDGGMAGGTTSIAAVPDLDGVRTVVDVGGGTGGLIGTLLAAHPHLRGTLVERPALVAAARERLARNGLAGRCHVVAGDFLDAVPAGGDLYVLSRVLPDWSDARCEVILRNVRRAMGPAARLLVVARPLPNDDRPSFNRIADLHLLVLMGGGERTLDEYRALLGDAGFAMRRVLPTPDHDVCLIEAAVG